MLSIRIFRQSCLLFLICVAASFVEAYNDQNPPVAPPTNFTPGLDISFDRFFTIDTAQLAAPPGFVGSDCNISPSSLVPNGTLTVILPPTIHGNNSDTFEAIHAQTLKVSLPYLLEQMGVHQKKIPKLVERGIPLFETAIKEIVSDPDDSDGLARRGIIEDFVEFVKDVGEELIGGIAETTTDVTCSLFAAGGLPGYLVVAGLLRAQNIFETPKASTQDQDFFIFPLHGGVSHNDGISLFYSANIPPWFGNAKGVTIGRDIYLRRSEATRFMEHSNFRNATRTVLHEFTHTKQYRAGGYSLAIFGTQYLFNFCKGGFEYRSNVMEKDAFAKQKLVNSLLYDKIGFQFATIWKKKNLRATLGLPTARSYTLLFSILNYRVFALAMQRGRMTIVCSGDDCS